jgi:hypothetical protein
MSGTTHDRRAIERLARESQVSIGEVTRLYQEARARLEVGASIKGFIGIFAIRDVRGTLRQRRRSTARRPTRIPARLAEATGRTPA